MGLDFECGDMCMRVGSYSTVAKLRDTLLRCTYEFIKHDTKEATIPFRKELLEHLNKILLGDMYISPFVSCIGYKHIYNNYSEIHRLLLNYNCEGMLLFVCHSDCEGNHSVKEVKKIIKWLNQIFTHENNEVLLLKNYFIDNNKSENNLYNRFYLSKMFDYSIEMNQPIEYC